MILGALIPGWKYVSAGVGILVLGFVAWWILDAYVFTPSDLHDEEAKVLEAVVEDFQSKLIDHLNEVDERSLSLAIAPIPEDTSNEQFRKTLQSDLGDGKRIVVDRKSFFEKVKSDGASLFNDEGEKMTADAIFADKSEIDSVLVFDEPKQTSTATEQQLEMTATLFHRFKKGDETHDKEISLTSYKRVSFESGEILEDDEEGEGARGFWGMLGLTLIGVLCALGVPFLWLPATDAVSSSGNNVLGIAYLVVVVATAMTPYFLFGLALPFGILLGLVTAAWTYRMHDAWSERMRI